PAAGRALGGVRGRRRPAGGGVRRVASAPRGARRPAARRARLRGHALGGRGPARLRRLPRRLGERRAVARRRHGAARAPRAAAGLDALSAEEKALLQHAAVHGKVFWTGGLVDGKPADRRVVEERLHGLERKEFVQRARRSSVAGETEYAFRHLLLRDVAYGQI